MARTPPKTRTPLQRRRSLRQQVAARLRADILAERHEAGRLPSVRKLASQFGCSTIVISGALDVLEEEGLLVRRQGKGVFVKAEALPADEAPSAARTRNIALFSRGTQPAMMEDTYYSEVWAGMLHSAAAASCRLTVSQLTRRDPRDQVMRTAEDVALDGVVLLGISDRRTVSAVAEVGFPVVVADHSFDDLDVDCVDLDSEGGSVAAVRHLVGLGHSRIGYMSNPQADYNPPRYRGYLRAMADAGLDVEAKFLVRGKPSLAGGYELMRGLLEDGRELPTAFVSYGSTMVVGAVRALEEAGLRVPEDVSLIGAGSRWFSNVYPRVTIVAAEAHLLGIEAVKTLLARLARPQRPPVKKLLPMELLRRETTAAPGGKG
ncbi:MAG: GntR family transcriptional regulator [Planctomycetota bacterium]|jgi:DNA-binding LacI/PurR family transcriptional regulator